MKPIQEQLLGWHSKVKQGNVIVIESEDSPVLNYFNSEEDRKHVVGEKSLNIADNIEFKREVFQIIESTPYVELKDGSYKLSAKIKNTGNFHKLAMYAESGGKQKTTEITAENDTWITIEIDNVQVRNEKVEIGFIANGEAEASSQIDDVSLVRN